MFELFTKKGGKVSSPKITIAAAGYIGFNSACMAKYFKNKNFVQLYWDKDRKIGFKPIEKETAGAFKISSAGSGKPGSIAGRSFLKYYEIDFSKSKGYIPEWNEKEEMLVIKI